MTRYFRRHKWLTALCIVSTFLVLCWGWSPAARIRGRIAARIDVHRGRYEVLGYGLSSPSHPEYARCLRERYNVEFRAVAGCIVSDSLISYVDGYHSVVAEATKRKFGHDIFQECADEATRKWKAKRAAGTRDVELRQ